MRELLLISFPSEAAAERALNKFLSIRKEYPVAVEDAVVVVKEPDGAIKVSQLSDQSSLWEVRAAASGNHAPIGAGALTDFGTSDKFVRDVAGAISSGSAALLVLMETTNSDKALAGLRTLGGEVLRTSFDNSAIDVVRASATLCTA
jgi:uncharacterized membrane protein